MSTANPVRRGGRKSAAFASIGSGRDGVTRCGMPSLWESAVTLSGAFQTLASPSRTFAPDFAPVALGRSEVYVRDAEKQMLKAVFAASFALLLAFETGAAQVATARLEGVVRDPSGRVVPGAKVFVVNTRTQERVEASVTAGTGGCLCALHAGRIRRHSPTSRTTRRWLSRFMA